MAENKMENCYKTKEGQEERLTTKHIATLQLLQEIGRENKELKEKVLAYEHQFLHCKDLHDLAQDSQERIQDIQAECLLKLDITSELLLEKHRAEMMKKVEEHIEEEKTWAAEREELKAEIDNLKFCMVSKDAMAADLEKSRGSVETLQLKLNSLQQKNEKLLEEKAKNAKILSEHEIVLQELDFVKSKVCNMEEELKAAEQINTEMKLHNAKLEKEIDEIKAASHETLIDTLRREVKKLMSERAERENEIKEKGEQVVNLKSEILKLRKAWSDSEIMRKDLQSQVTELKEQISAYQRQGNDRNFGEFVQLKRQAALLKSENDELRSKLKVRYSVSTPQREPLISAILRDGSSRRNSESMSKITSTKHR